MKVQICLLIIQKIKNIYYILVINVFEKVFISRLWGLIMEFEEVMKRFVEIYGEGAVENPESAPKHYVRVSIEDEGKVGFVDGFMFDRPSPKIDGLPSYVNICLLFYDLKSDEFKQSHLVQIDGPETSYITRIDKLIDESDLIKMLKKD